MLILPIPVFVVMVTVIFVLGVAVVTLYWERLMLLAKQAQLFGYLESIVREVGVGMTRIDVSIPRTVVDVAVVVDGILSEIRVARKNNESTGDQLQRCVEDNEAFRVEVKQQAEAAFHYGTWCEHFAVYAVPDAVAGRLRELVGLPTGRGQRDPKHHTVDIDRPWSDDETRSACHAEPEAKPKTMKG